MNNVDTLISLLPESALWLPVIVLTGLALWASGHALLYKRDHVAAFGWLVTCLLFPLAGPLLYYLFGINRIRTRARRLKVLASAGLTTESAVVASKTLFKQAGLPSWANITAQVSFSTPFALCKGNSIDVLYNGDQAYPAMLNAISAAQHQILLSSFIFNVDDIGCIFMDALANAKKRGVEVKVLIDGVGERYSWHRITKKLCKLGIDAVTFLPPRLFPPQVNLNLRNHRKILLIDGRTAFTGGMNISINHCLKTHAVKRSIQDLHFRLQGSSCLQLWQVFAEDWMFVTGESLTIPAVEHVDVGKAICRVVVDGPNEDLDSLPMLINGVISSARKRIIVMTPYFLPPRELISALLAACMRGVEVVIILPASNNLPFVHWATRRVLPELIERGVQVYYQPAPFAHSKLCLIDDYYCLLGSANLDPRSLTLNFEAVVEVFDRKLSDALDTHCQQLLALSRHVSLEEFKQQRLLSRLRDALCWLFSSYL